MLGLKHHEARLGLVFGVAAGACVDIEGVGNDAGGMLRVDELIFARVICDVLSRSVMKGSRTERDSCLVLEIPKSLSQPYPSLINNVGDKLRYDCPVCCCNYFGVHGCWHLAPLIRVVPSS